MQSSDSIHVLCVGFHLLRAADLVPKLCLTLETPWTVARLLFPWMQARKLEWVATSFSRESSWPKNQTEVSCVAGGFFTTEPPGKYYQIYMLSYLCKWGWKVKVKVKSLSPVRLFVTPWTVQSTRLLHPWNSPGKNTGVGCHCGLGIKPRIFQLVT